MILSYKDPTKQVGVKGGIQTDSASCVPVYPNGCYEWYKPYYRRDVEFHRGVRHVYIEIWQMAPGEWSSSTRFQVIPMRQENTGQRLAELSLQCEACDSDLYVKKKKT